MPSREKQPHEAGIPAMEVLRIRDIRLHEEVDLARVAALIERLGSDGILRNPPIVARLADGRRLLLDGANRIEALRRMGMQHSLVQTETFADDALGLTHWNHVIRSREAALILEAPPPATRFHRPRESAGPEGQPLCRLWSRDGEATVLLGHPGPAERAAALRELCARYTHPRARLARIAHRDLDEVRSAYPEFGGLLEYSDISKEQVLATTEAGARLPSGITRFLVPRRVLGFNLPLSFLETNLPLDEKRRRLEDLVADRFETGRVRYYAEPAFVFDD
ncbi:MAG: hypothetical protein OXH05_00780 [Acidobacteria bacterium]|nr:hypothetical protein [Acidobacteriota bacterium]